MKKTSSIKDLAFLLLGIAGCLFTNLSYAGNSNSFFMGDDAALTAGAIAAHTRDSEAIWYNPAGLGGNKLTRLDLSGTVFMLRLQKAKNAMAVELPSGTQSDDLTGNEYLAVPSALTFARKATEKLSYGFGIYIPQYSDYSFNNTISSKNEDFSSIGIKVPVNYEQGFNLDTLAVQYHLGGAVGYEVNESFRVGAALFALYSKTRYDQSQFENLESADPSVDLDLFSVESERAIVSSIGVRATGGLQFDITKEWKAGFVVFSPAFQVYSWGNYSLDTGSVWLNDAGVLSSLAYRVSSKISEVEGKMIEPLHFQASAAWERPDFWIGAAADIYLPLRTPSLFIDKKTNWNVCIGSKFRLSEKIWGGAGFFTDNSDQKTPNEFGDDDVNYYGLTFGSEFKTPIKRYDDTNIPPIVFSTVLAGRYALGIGHIGGSKYYPLGTKEPELTLEHVYFQEFSLYVGTALYF